jgi:hypothetical protein
MPILPTRKSQDGRGTKQPIDAGQLGARDDGEIAPNREGLFVMAKQPKTIDELRSDIRMTGNGIDAHWLKAMPLAGPIDLESLRYLESNANALHIYCKLLRQRLEAQDPAIQHLRKTLAEGE